MLRRSSSQVLKRAVQRSLRRLTGYHGKPLLLHGEHEAVRPHDQLLEMPGIPTDGGVNGKGRSTKIDIQGVDLLRLQLTLSICRQPDSTRR